MLADARGSFLSQMSFGDAMKAKGKTVGARVVDFSKPATATDGT